MSAVQVIGPNVRDQTGTLGEDHSYRKKAPAGKESVGPAERRLGRAEVHTAQGGEGQGRGEVLDPGVAATMEELVQGNLPPEEVFPPLPSPTKKGRVALYAALLGKRKKLEKRIEEGEARVEEAKAKLEKESGVAAMQKARSLKGRKG